MRKGDKVFHQRLGKGTISSEILNQESEFPGVAVEFNNEIPNGHSCNRLCLDKKGYFIPICDLIAI